MKEGEKPPVDSRLVGLLIVAAIVLVIILVRWGRFIPWGAR
ncbi:MAG: hypothetical protein ACM3JB_08090 [Acidobacteriaceae bacterium]